MTTITIIIIIAGLVGFVNEFFILEMKVSDFGRLSWN